VRDKISREIPQKQSRLAGCYGAGGEIFIRQKYSGQLYPAPVVLLAAIILEIIKTCHSRTNADFRKTGAVAQKLADKIKRTQFLKLCFFV
jgi:hypothetical protein